MVVRYQISIPVRIMKENADIYTDVLHFSFNNSIYQSEFPSIFRLVNMTPVFKKGDKNSEENYRPVSILSNVSNIFERFVKFPDLWIPIYQNNNVGLEKVAAHSITYW